MKTIKMLLLSGLLSFFFTNMFAQSPTLIAQWLFNNSPEDETANNHDLTNYGNYSENSVEGSYSLSANCSGCYAISDQIDLGGYFSITGWSIFGNSDYYTLFSNKPNNEASGFAGLYYAEDNGNYVNVKFYFQTFNGSGGQMDLSTPFVTIQKYVWTHFAFVVDKVSGSGAIYINGNSISLSENTIYNTFNSSNNIILGRGTPDGGYPLWSVLDDFRIYSGLLNETQINSVMNFEPLSGGTTYDLTTSASPSANGSVNPSSGTYSSGTVVSVTATPNTGYSFTGWSGAATGLDNPLNIIMDGDKMLTANFAYVPVESVTVTPNPAYVAPGGTIQLNAEVLPANATDKNIMWIAQCNPSILTVDQNGWVTALGSAGDNGIVAAQATSNGFSGTTDVIIGDVTTEPSVSTNGATYITYNSATSGGSVTSSGGATVTARGVCWSTSPNPTPNLSTKTNDGTGIGSFNSSITGLAGNTTYYLRAYATNSEGTGYGQELTFTTSPSPVAPVVTTTTASSITETGATSGGNVTSSGGATVTERGVCWSTSENPTISLGTKTSDGSGTGTFTSSITGLTSGTTYHIRAYATNSAGTGYGSDLTFTAGLWLPNGDGISYDGKVGIGMDPATSLPDGYQLAVDGKIIATEIKVQSDIWADFVFDNSYILRSLGDLEKYINEHKHLPDMPSVKDVEQSGISLGEMNAKLLQKIEELTLYLIEQDRKLEEKERQIEELMERVEKLEKK